MRLTAKIAITTSALCLTLVCYFSGPASARPRDFGGWLWNYYDYPWCIYTPDDFYDCSYESLAQCNATRAGVGGGCYRNPRYAYAPRRSQPRPPAKRNYQ
jgi:hypothetical protein